MTSTHRSRPSEPILHVDLDAFYASVEVLKDPSLAGKPVVVGSAGPRGVIMSASYRARARGLHSAMPSVRAKRLCPEAVFVPPDFDSYRAYSNRFREILLSMSPAVEPLALDEAFVDVSGGTLLFGSPAEIGARIRTRITEELALTASVGVGPSKLVAKLASTRAKPDGMLAVPADEVLAFLHPLPVGALWGIGEKTGEVLGRLGIRTIGELAGTPPAIRLRSEGYRARTVTLKLRLPSFSTLTRSRTLPAATDVGAEIFTVARELFLHLPAGRRRFRLIGVAATGLVPAGAEQLALVREGQWRDAERALDRVRRRFGTDAAIPAALLHRPDRRQ